MTARATASGSGRCSITSKAVTTPKGSSKTLRASAGATLNAPRGFSCAARATANSLTSVPKICHAGSSEPRKRPKAQPMSWMRRGASGLRCRSIVCA